MKRIVVWGAGAAVLIVLAIGIVRVAFKDPHVARGRAVYLEYCVGCHGGKGRGDGFNAKNLDPAPRDLTDRVDTFMGDSTNEELYKGIREGIAGAFPTGPQTAEQKAAEAKKAEEDEEGSSPLMPYWGFTLTDEEIWELVAYIRTLHKNEADKIEFKEKGAEGEKEEGTGLSRPQPVAFPSADSPAGRAKIEEGKLLYETRYSCSGCHRINGKGGQIGPDLSRAGFRMNATWIYQWIQYPQSFRHETKMPAFNMPEADAVAITMYLKTLRADVSSAKAPGKDPA